MLVYEKAPAVLVFWRGQRTADAIGGAIPGHVAKDSTPSLIDCGVPLACGLFENQADMYDCD